MKFSVILLLLYSYNNRLLDRPTTLVGTTFFKVNIQKLLDSKLFFMTF